MTEKILSFNEIKRMMTDDDYDSYDDLEELDELNDDGIEELEYDEEGGMLGEEY